MLVPACAVLRLGCCSQLHEARELRYSSQLTLVAQKQFLDSSNFQVYSHGQPRTVAREYPETSGGSNLVHEDYLLCVHHGVQSFSGFVSHLPVKSVLGESPEMKIT